MATALAVDQKGIDLHPERFLDVLHVEIGYYLRVAVTGRGEILQGPFLSVETKNNWRLRAGLSGGRGGVDISISYEFGRLVLVCIEAGL